MAQTVKRESAKAHLFQQRQGFAGLSALTETVLRGDPYCGHLFGALVAETILTGVHVRAHKQAGHRDASDLIKALQKNT